MSIYLQAEYVTVECGSEGCNQHFAMSAAFYRRTKDEKLTWYCPSGHPRIWRGPTTSQRLEAAQARERHLADQLLAAEMEAETVRVRLIRDRHRFSNGVCPCCNRSFENVRRHMTTKHPDYDPADLSPPRYKCSCGRSFESIRGLRTHQGHNRTADWAQPSTSRYSRHLTVTDA